MKNLKSFLEEFNHSVDFQFLGSTLTVSKERNIYNQIEKKYFTLASSAMQRFRDYSAKLTNLDDLIASAPDLFILALEEALTQVALDAISVGVHTLDSASIIDECFNGNYFDRFVEAYNAYIQAQDRIVSNLSDSCRYRENRKQLRGRWTSATFGGNVFDAWGNQIRSGAMNVTEGIGHSLINAIGNANSEYEAKEAMKSLFNNPKLRENLVNSAFYCCKNLKLVVINIVSKKAGLQLGGWVTDNDSKKSESVFNNLMNLSLPLEQQYQMMNEVIALNPYGKKYYIGALKKFNVPNSELQPIADFFGITGLEDIKIEMLVDFVRENIGQSEEDAKLCQEDLDSRVFNFGLQKEQCDDAYQLITDRLTKLDFQYRTVKGVVLETRELADTARNDLIIYNEILESPPQFIFRSNYISHIQKIEELPLDSKLKTQYIGRYNTQLAEFDKKCRIAGRHTFRLEHNNLLWNGDMRNTLFHVVIFAFSLFATVLMLFDDEIDNTATIVWFVIMGIHLLIFFIGKPTSEKKIHDELTHNGEYRLDEIMKS